MGTLLEAIGIVLETYFGFRFPNACPIGHCRKGPGPNRPKVSLCSRSIAVCKTGDEPVKWID